MAEFELRGKRGLIAKFSSDVDPRDEGACVALLRAQAAAAGQKKVAELELTAKERGRVVRRYRTT